MGGDDLSFIMKPHMNHIRETLARKQVIEEVANKDKTYDQYKHMVDTCLKNGFSKERIIDELEAEMERINSDQRIGDILFNEGKKQSKIVCLDAIQTILNELKGEKEDGNNV